jgi:hypothetical protein
VRSSDSSLSVVLVKSAMSEKKTADAGPNRSLADDGVTAQPTRAIVSPFAKRLKSHLLSRWRT